MKKIEKLMLKLNKGPRIIIGLILFFWLSGCSNLYPPMDVILGGIFCVLAIIWVSCSFIYKTPKQLEAEKEKKLRAIEQDLRFKEAENRKAQLAEEERARKARQAEWERTHGRMVTRLAGVTFDNPDGSSRQKNLRAAYEDNCDGDITLDVYLYNGADAIRVLYEGREIGNIPAATVTDVMAVFDRVDDASLAVEIFEPDDWDENGRKPQKIYRADLTLIYKKDEVQSL